MRKIDELIWHCAATPAGKYFDAADIDRFHKARGWNGIGYHKVVLLDGTVEDGRPESSLGAHVRGHNTGSIGYCYIGGVSANNPKKAEDTRTPAQKRTMLRLTKEAIAKYDLKKVSGHHDYANKACPSFPAKSEYAYLLTDAKPLTTEVSALRAGDRGWRVKSLQGRLVDLGYPLVVDSHFGRATKHAVAAFQLDSEIASDGIAGPQTMAALETAPPPESGARSEGGAEELRERGSRIVKKADAVETTAKWSLGGMAGAKLAGAGGALSGISSLVGQGQEVQGIFGAVTDLFDFASAHWFWLLIIVGAFVVWQMRGIRLARVEDHQSGKTV